MAQIDDLCLDNLDEFVNDENKLVTYKWLSRSLSIHVNQAKQVLYQFLMKQRNDKNNDELFATYFLSGLCQENDSLIYKVEVVPEQVLESAKSAYTQLTSCHVYSVQKGKLKDSNALYIADYDLMKEHIIDSNRFSAVQCPSAVKCSDDEAVDVLQTKSTNTSPVKCKDEPVSQASVHEEKKVKKPVGIAGMFSKLSKKQGSVKQISTSKGSGGVSSKDASSKVENKSKSADIMNLFSKQVTPKEEKETRPAPSQQSETPKQVKSNKRPVVGVTDGSNTKRSKKKKVDSDEEEHVHQEKKRRRIKQVMPDSSSSEDEMEAEEPLPSPPPSPPPASPVDSDPDEIPPTPSPQSHGTEPGSVRDEQQSDGAPSKIQKKKLITKTYLDEDGALCTEKVYVNEWEEVTDQKADSSDAAPVEEKAEVETKKTSKAPGRASPVKPSDRKQMTLTSFFKKK